MGEHRRGQSSDDRGSRDIHAHHQAAAVNAVDNHAKPAAEQQPRQALHRGGSRHRSRRAGHLGREQRESRQPDAISEVGDKAGQPVARKRFPQPASKRDHSTIMPQVPPRSTSPAKPWSKRQPVPLEDRQPIQQHPQVNRRQRSPRESSGMGCGPSGRGEVPEFRFAGAGPLRR
jgi:hypothetical protein